MSESMRYLVPSIATLFLLVEGCFAQMAGTAQRIGTFTSYNPADCTSTGAQYIGFTYYNFSGDITATVQRMGLFTYNFSDGLSSSTNQQIGPFRCNNWTNSMSATSQSVRSLTTTLVMDPYHPANRSFYVLTMQYHAREPLL